MFIYRLVCTIIMIISPDFSTSSSTVYFSTPFPFFVSSLPKARQILFKRGVEQRSSENSSLLDAWFQASCSRLSFKVGILIERRQKAVGPGSPCFTVASIILSPRSCRAPFSLDARPFSRYRVALTGCLESKDYVRLLLGAS